MPNISKELNKVTDLAARITADAKLSGILAHKQTLSGVVAKSLTIKDTRFEQIAMTGCELRDCWLDDVVIYNCDISANKLPKLSVDRAVFKSTRLSGIQLHESVLKDVSFVDCKLDLANFRFAKLKNVIFDSCVLTEADFAGATFNNVSFDNCELDKADFSNTKCTKLDLRGSSIVDVIGISSLKGAIVSPEQLISLAPQLAAEIGLVVEQD